MRTIMTPVKFPYSVSSVSACTMGTPHSEIFNINSIPHRYKYFSGSSGLFANSKYCNEF